MEEYRAVLFWVFMGFFIIIGIVSLLAVVGILKTDPRFRKWALSGFVAAVTGAMITLFKITFGGEVALFVTLLPPQETVGSTLDLVSGSYKTAGEVKTRSGDVELTLQEGGWVARLPQDVLDKAVELIFKDRNGKQWRVQPFYPKHNRKQLVPLEHASAASHEQASGEARSLIPPSPVLAEEGSLGFNNYARPIGELHGRTYYRWRVFLDEPRLVLNRIAEVQYLLHPTFPEPFQVRRDPGTKFALETSGWGSFMILITIHYKDGRVQKRDYYLDLSKGWPAIE